MLKKFRNEKYKNGLTTHVGDFLESLLNDVAISAIKSAPQLPVTSTGSVLKDELTAMAGDCDQANPHKA
ncbi:hypothetical protein OQX61_09110 [Pedobacter sp. PLR]|uniref:hypothetical protein n=1 Tax=Pedobacter sp. PLR TaxID=2994465 RepID=UPI0022451597|nr:hypothetical protein [Pedobacter sp. PLR]MCX2451429.1 hypothetical protein [Pedobacter sp. PLR]